jgi:2-polyprenyl-3-methyl-5-hydroxy-6-metoxy-1,4-benzoquinol methylase
VICNDVIEHMPDDEFFLRDIQSKMAPDGRLLGSIPNMRHWPVLKDLVFKKEFDYQDMGVLDRTHLRFYTVKSFPKLLEKTGFTLEVFTGINRSIKKSTRALLWFLGWGRFNDVGFIQFAFVARLRKPPGNNSGQP